MSEKKAMRLELLALTKAYPGCIANDSVSLQVEPGEIHALLGENGAGKSTLMKMIYGVVKPDAGQMLWNDKEVSISGPAHARQLGMGMVFQHFELFPHLSVTENLTLAQIKVLGRSPSDALAHGLKYLDRVGLSAQKDKFPGQLSGGQQQRLSIART